MVFFSLSHVSVGLAVLASHQHRLHVSPHLCFSGSLDSSDFTLDSSDFTSHQSRTQGFFPD